MKTTIAVNTRLLKPGKLEGVGWFTWQTLRRVVTNHPEVDFHFIFDAPPPESFTDFANVTSHMIIPPARRIVLYKLWFDYLLPRKLRSINPDLFLSPDGFASLRTAVPQLIVIHDLNFEHHPEWMPAKVASFYRERFPKFARVAKRIATVSEYSASDIQNCYHRSSSDIDVVYNGVNEGFKPLSEHDIQEVRRDLTDGHPYFVFVGSLHPRKNIVRLLRAFERFKDLDQRGLKLVIIGSKMWNDSNFDQAVANHRFRDDLVFTGRASTEVLSRWVAAAESMCFVPLFEGFGIPILEAFASGIPLIASNVTSLPEVCGDAALLVDPESEASIAEAMVSMASQPELRQSLVEKGYERLSHFSWDRTADLLWQSIQKSLRNG